MRKMWTMAFKLFSDDPDKYSKTTELQQYFGKLFENLEDRPLQNVTSFESVCNS